MISNLIFNHFNLLHTESLPLQMSLLHPQNESAARQNSLYVTSPLLRILQAGISHNPITEDNKSINNYIYWLTL